MANLNKEARKEINNAEVTEDNPDKVKSVLRSAALMSACTLLSRVTGFIRTWAMAFALGNTILASGFSLANNMPNMIYELVAGGALAAAFVPIYHVRRNAGGKESALEYGRNLLSLAIIVLGAIAILASIFSPAVMFTQSLFSSSDDTTVEYAVWFFRFFAFQMVFYGISAILSGILNAEREYLWPAISSVFMNIICIATFFVYPVVSAQNPDLANVVLAVGTVLSIAVMAFVQFPALKRIGFKFKFRFKLHGSALRETFNLALPAIISTAINLVALSFMNSCALLVAQNGPSSVSYAWMWYQFPYGVLGVALSTALFTEMSDYASKGDWSGYARSVRGGLKTTWIFIIPMAMLVFVCSWMLIGLYSAGKFTPEDVEPISLLLRVWAINLPLYAAYMFISQAYSACKDMRTVAVANLFMTCIQLLLYMTFTGYFSQKFNFGLMGLALADVVKYALIDVILLVVLSRRCGALKLKLLVKPVAKVILASVIAGIAGTLVEIVVSSFVNTYVFFGALVGLVIVGAVTLILILALAHLLKIDELLSLERSILRKIKKRQ